MKTLLSISLLIVVIAIGCGEETETRENDADASEIRTMGSIEKLDDELDQVLDSEAVPEVIGEGYEWSEGPVWVEDHEMLLFSDIPANTIYQWNEEEGVTPYLSPSGYTGEEDRGGEMGSNGLIIDREGRLLLCQHGDRRIARMDAPLTEPAPEFATLADNYGGNQLNSPNDIVQHSSGDLYFTDPPYGLEQGVDDPARELDFQGVYRIDGDGNITLLTDELSRPNGLAFSPDEGTLYVANSDPDNPIWMAYEITGEGELADGRVFYDVSEHTGEEPGLPDGMKVDEEGYIYATGPGGVWIFNPDGEALGRIKTGQATSNCALGNDGNVLYMTADSYLLRLALQ